MSTYLDTVRANGIMIKQNINLDNDVVEFVRYPDNKVVFSFTPTCTAYYHKNNNDKDTAGTLRYSEDGYIVFNFNKEFLKANPYIYLFNLTFSTKDFIKAEALLLTLLLTLHPKMFKE